MNTIQKIEIFFSQPNWDYQLDTLKTGSDAYLMAATIKINGLQLDSVGVKYKGNSSYDSTFTKNPLHISIDEFKNQDYQGINDIKLGNGFADPSLIREVLSYHILKDYMYCPEANFAEVYINGNYIGIYSNIENIGKKFCNAHFYSSQNTFIKCNPNVTPGPTTKSSLRYLSNTDSTGYYNFYDMKSNTGWNELKNLCDSVSNNVPSIPNLIDLDRAIWMLAYNNVLVNLDSYTGAFAQNYYLYKDNTGHFNPVIWDLNMSFGGFPYAGSGASSLGSLSIANMQQMPLTLHSNDSNWPLIKAIMNNAMYKKMYVAHMRTILNEYFANNNYQTVASQLQALIDTSVAADSNKFYNYTQFQNGLTTNYSVGNYSVPGISNLMNARVTYLQSTPEFLASTPVISNITLSNNLPIINSSITITASVTSTNSVYFGYRSNVQDKFVRVQMYDDGLHNDGQSGDNIFGASIGLLALQTQYYLYAENNNAGIFSPERAEHEFYYINAAQQNLSNSQVVINEFVANNTAGVSNELGSFEDWIELYNNTDSIINLSGYYLTDTIELPTKFAFPANSIILPHNYLTIWADENSSTSTYIHCNFKLSSLGEKLMLSNGNGLVIDSLSFNAQQTNYSQARCPNGTGSFVFTSTPTFNASNCTDGLDENTNENSFTIHPNPSNEFMVISTQQIIPSALKIYNSIGNEVYQTTVNRTEQINVSNFAEGIYFIKCNEVIKRFIIIR